MGDNRGVAETQLSGWERLVRQWRGEEVIVERHREAPGWHPVRFSYTRERGFKQCLSLPVVCDQDIRRMRLIEKMHDALRRVARRDRHDCGSGSQ